MIGPQILVYEIAFETIMFTWPSLVSCIYVFIKIKVNFVLHWKVYFYFWNYFQNYFFFKVLSLWWTLIKTHNFMQLRFNWISICCICAAQIYLWNYWTVNQLHTHASHMEMRIYHHHLSEKYVVHGNWFSEVEQLNQSTHYLFFSFYALCNFDLIR